MIYYICDSKHAYTLTVFLQYFQNDFRERIRIISYDDLFRLKRLDIGIFIFTDFDRIGPQQLKRTKELIAHLQSCDPDVVILNHPMRSLKRYDLLAALHAADHNAPAVARLSKWHEVRNFPVFIRGENDHLSALSGLISTRPELEAAAQPLLAKHVDSDDLIVIQFKNAPNAQGYYEKYGAFRVGDAIYGQHLFQNEDWWVKENTAEWTEAQSAQNSNYVQQNPHADLLMPYFEAAGIEYGRIDYCLMGDQVVVFEINTNPVVNTRPQAKSSRFDAQLYADLHNSALATLPTIDGVAVAMPFTTPQKWGAMTVEKAHRKMISKVKRKLLRRRIRAILTHLRFGKWGRARVS
jgi:hypothetical protein